MVFIYYSFAMISFHLKILCFNVHQQTDCEREAAVCLMRKYTYAKSVLLLVFIFSRTISILKQTRRPMSMLLSVCQPYLQTKRRVALSRVMQLLSSREMEKVYDENVHITPEMKDLPRTITVNEKELCKYFAPDNHVKVVSGTQECATKVEQHVLIILSDTTKEHIRVFADDVVESSEVTTKLGVELLSE
ncbi:uncharacterized protein LOC126667406 [Mercurialis annua]|uniref:uncharacterized protein LOC126667406 n=1 Tax=Mercurialis annua TaxID=3986 RepID=UPI00215F5F2D|nr:uncharacterized protein LOC126667406 [Mercurialis annua]